jgi:hypothetical protein
VPRTAVQFSSPYDNLRLIRRPPEERIMPNGAVAIVKPEIVIEFVSHMYFAIEGRNLLPDLWSDEVDDFTDQDELSWLRAHSGLNQFFHEIPVEVPPSGDAFREIARLAARGDREALMKMGREEVDGHNREDVLDLLRDTIESLPEDAVAGG